MATTDRNAVALAHRMVDLARVGDNELIADGGAGVPVEFTDAVGNTLVMLSA